MTDAVERYLERLRNELSESGAPQVEDAVRDAREYLEHELWTLRRERAQAFDRAGSSEEQLFSEVERKFGSPATVASSYSRFHRTESFFKRIWAKKRAWSRAPGWKLECRRCGRSGDLDASGPFVWRVGARSLSPHLLGWCTECRRLRFLRMFKS